jgi:hypothetical protein
VDDLLHLLGRRHDGVGGVLGRGDYRVQFRRGLMEFVFVGQGMAQRRHFRLGRLDAPGNIGDIDLDSLDLGMVGRQEPVESAAEIGDGLQHLALIDRDRDRRGR